MSLLPMISPLHQPLSFFITITYTYMYVIQTPEEYLHSTTCVHLLREAALRNVTYFDPWKHSQQWNLPEWVDWRTKGILTPVKDQVSLSVGTLIMCPSNYAIQYFKPIMWGGGCGGGVVEGRGSTTAGSLLY